MYKRLLIALSFILPSTVFAQSKYSLGLGIGLSNHTSDIQSLEDFPRGTSFAYGLNISRRLSSKWSLKSNYMGTTLNANEMESGKAWQMQRGFSYKNKLNEVGLGLEWEMRGDKRYTNGIFKKTFSPYLYAGIAQSFFQNNTNYNLILDRNPVIDPSLITKDIAERKKSALVIPLGGGLRFDINKNYTLSFDVLARLVNSDFLDGISHSGNPKKKDSYGAALLNLQYRFSQKDSDNDRIVVDVDFCPNKKGPRRLKGCPDHDQDGIADKDDACPNAYGSEKLGGCPDTDNDGVIDSKDNCPDIPGEIALDGCPDKDHDLVIDGLDACPDVPGTAYGCPDADKDGVADKDDICPTIAGLKESNGCPADDSDGDGILNNDDKCPTIAGSKFEKGCPLKDLDKDGVEDINDLCPDVAGLGSFNGCPDTDGDGTEDSKDACPTVSGAIEYGGCPTLENNKPTDIKDSKSKSYEDLNQDLSLIKYGIKFNSSSDVLSKSSYASLMKIVGIMKSNPAYNLEILGHTDNVGNAQKNMILSERRAKNCSNFLESKGINRSRLKYKGFGSTMPVSTNDTSEGRNQNRRVEFVLIPK